MTGDAQSPGLSFESWPHIIGMRLSRNFGQHAATVCGIEQARGQWIITMDDDLEHPPEAIPDMLDAASEEVPVIYGNFPKRTHSGIRNFSFELLRWNEPFPTSSRTIPRFASFTHPWPSNLFAWESIDRTSTACCHG